jgi:hypothetical protein
MTTPDETDAGTSSTDDAPTVAADVTSPGEPLTEGRDAPSSGPLHGTGGGTASGTPLAGTGSPPEDPVHPDGSDEDSSELGGEG